jgi:hypothetical protein
MIWIGIYIFGGVKRRFRIEFNAYKNEWVEFPDWLRVALDNFIALMGNGDDVFFNAVETPTFLVTASLDPLPLSDFDFSEEDSDEIDEVFIAGINSCHTLNNVMLWVEGLGGIKLNKTNGIETTYILPQSEDNQKIMDGWEAT